MTTQRPPRVGLLEPGATVLLAARLRSRGTIDDISSAVLTLSDGSQPDSRAVVEQMIDQRFLQSRGEIGRLSLTTAGAEKLRVVMAETTAQVGRSEVEVAYREFISVNGDFLRAVSSWQSQPLAGSNTFAELVGRITPALRALSSLLPWFSCYLPRFDHALACAADRREWIESPTIDSVHTIWFELHEHLLALLGLERADEH